LGVGDGDGDCVGGGVGCTSSVGELVGETTEPVGTLVGTLVGTFVGVCVGVLGVGGADEPPVFRDVPTAVKPHWLPVNPFTQAGPVMAWSEEGLNAFR
jgi:hypothetical protein